MKHILVASILLFATGCATLETSVGIGASVGAVSGAVAGHSANYNIKGMVITTTTGAVVGGLIGLLLHKPTEPQSESIKTIKIQDSTEPVLKKAEKEILWIPGKTESDRYTEPHRVFLIKRPSHWIPPEDKEE